MTRCWSAGASRRPCASRFDYGSYPLDRQELSLRIWHVDFEKNVFLIPDITGYIDLNPKTLPGIDPQIVLENWKVEESYFSYRLATYNADFGILGYDPTVPNPELYFNIGTERYLLGPLFSQGIAPFIILLQLFVLVMVIGRNSKRLETFGVRPGAVLFTCAAYVFAVLIAQNGLRNEVRWPSLVYLEGLHVITYLAIVGVALNSVLLVAKPELELFRHGNAWVRILYWPVITGAMLAITAVAFLVAQARRISNVGASLRSRASAMTSRPWAAISSCPVTDAESTCPVALRSPVKAEAAAAASGEM